jgi:hypothetical protein
MSTTAYTLHRLEAEGCRRLADSNLLKELVEVANNHIFAVYK